MPLKLVPPRQGKSQNFTIRGTYLGAYVNRSAGTGKRAVALQGLKKIERDIESGEFSVKGEMTFKTAAWAYMKAEGEKTYVGKLLEYFGEAPLSKIDQQAIDTAAISLYPHGSAATRNRSVYTPVSAIVRLAGSRLDLKRPRGSGGNMQTSWLWPEQTEALFAEAGKLNKDFEALLIVLTYTGMRLSEALNLEWNNVRLEDGFAYVPDTKNGQPRAVFLPPVAVAALGNRPGDRTGARRVFPFTKGGHLYSLLKVAAFKAGVDLPERSAFHILRHTYGTWMMRYAGLNTKQLVATGTWKDPKSAERYAHTIVTEESQRAAMLPTPGRKKG
jgi:integrase